MCRCRNSLRLLSANIFRADKRRTKRGCREIRIFPGSPFVLSHKISAFFQIKPLLFLKKPNQSGGRFFVSVFSQRFQVFASIGILNDHWHDSIDQALPEQNQPAGSAVAIRMWFTSQGFFSSSSNSLISVKSSGELV